MYKHPVHPSLRLNRSKERIGPLRSIRLFRSRKAPFYHEFVVAEFRSSRPGSSTSWVRVERATGHKTRSRQRTVPTTNSFDPLFGGAISRETWSFSSDVSRLSPNADEWASAELLEDQVKVPLLFFPLFFDLISHIVISNPYHLFTTNCRWFARRTLHSVLQCWRVLFMQGYLFRWKGRVVGVEDLLAELAAERFGGKSIERSGGRQLSFIGADLSSPILGTC